MIFLGVKNLNKSRDFCFVFHTPNKPPFLFFFLINFTVRFIESVAPPL